MYFNSHPHEEDDKRGVARVATETHFNSHPHEEDDDRGRKGKIHRGYFNSHPHEEDDEENCGLMQETFISTHILTKRMTV